MPAGEPAPPATGAPTMSPPPGPTAIDEGEARRLLDGLMAELEREGNVTDRKVLDAMRATPRHLFVPESSLVMAYRDEPRPIGLGQTISQPTVVGMMTQALELTGKETVLEIGTGSGYQAAVLSRLTKRVLSIELLAPLGEAARERLARLGHANVEVRVGDGYAGWPERAPFDRILLTAAPPEMPPALLAQLAEGGTLVAPVGEENRMQRLIRLRKKGGKIVEEDLGAVRFVPMVKGEK
jgi:protein-L-isoaspartate(D-aspartate) O-methyltransferase